MSAAPTHRFIQPKEDGIRYYEKDGEKFPSVTSVLGLLGKKALVPWAAKCVAEYTAARLDHDSIYSKHDIVKHLTECRNAWVWESDKATGIGTNVHDMAEKVINPSVECTTTVKCREEENCMCAFYEWLNEHDVKVIETETAIYGNGFAGRIDMVVLLNGVVTLVDIKTSKSIYPEYRMQVAAYATAWNIDKPEQDQIKQVGVLRLCKLTGEYEYKTFTRTMLKDYVDFLTLALFFATHKSKDFARCKKLVNEIDELVYELAKIKDSKPVREPKPKKVAENAVATSTKSSESKSLLALINSSADACVDDCRPFVPINEEPYR